jgi:hypothetical protein
MREPSFLGWALLYSAAVTPLAAQDTAQCLPRDTAEVRRWHTTWDGMTLERLQELAGAQQGVISLEQPRRRVRVDRVGVYGEWAISAVLASHLGPDWTGTGRLRLEPPTEEFLAQHSDRDRLRKDRLLVGWLFGDSLIHQLVHPAPDSVEIVAVFERDGSLTIGQGYWMADGWGLEGTVDSPGRMRGSWYPPGAVSPPFLGWFCASILPATPRRGDEGPYRYP